MKSKESPGMLGCSQRADICEEEAQGVPYRKPASPPSPQYHPVFSYFRAYLKKISQEPQMKLATFLAEVVYFHDMETKI